MSGHNLSTVSISAPILCGFCEDFVITQKVSAKFCSECKNCFHSTCVELLQTKIDTKAPITTAYRLRLNRSQVCRKATNKLIEQFAEKYIKNFIQPIETWTGEQVAQWMLAVSMYRFTTLIENNKINGAELLTYNKDNDKLSRIRDSFQRKAFSKAIMTLEGSLIMPGECTTTTDFVNILRNSANFEPTDTVNHKFQLTSFFQEVICIVCNLNLLGLRKQGYQCMDCGIIVHKICLIQTDQLRYSNVKECSPHFVPNQVARISEYVSSTCQSSNFFTNFIVPDNTNVPFYLPPNTQTYFGQPLEAQPLDPNGNIKFLSHCFALLKKLTQDNLTSNERFSSNLDLFLLYKASSSSSNYETFRKNYADKLPTEETPASDLVQIIKFFLSELLETIIPSKYYTQFVPFMDESKFLVHSELLIIINKMEERQRNLLSLILDHLANVWTYQSELKKTTVQILMKMRPEDFVSIEQKTLDHVREMNNIENLGTIFHWYFIRPDLRVDRSILQVARKHASLMIKIINAWRPLNLEANKDVDEKLNKISLELSKMSFDETISMTEEECLQANQQDLEKHDWYWGNVSRENINYFMLNFRDGSFLVRDASKNSPAPFTLSVKWNGENRLRRIFFKNKLFYYMRNETQGFPLISLLIEELQKENNSLETSIRLLDPVSKAKYNSSTFSLQNFIKFNAMTNEQLTEQCDILNNQIRTLTEKYQRFVERSENLNFSILETSQKIAGHRIVERWFSEQSKLLKTTKLSIRNVPESVYIEQSGMIEKFSKNNANEMTKQINIEQGYHEKNQENNENQCQIQTVIQQIFTDRENIENMIKKTSPEAKLNTEDKLRPITRISFIQDSSNWLLTDKDLIEKASRNIWNAQVGTFFIRPSSDGCYLTLCVKTQTGLKKLKIEKDNNKYHVQGDQKVFPSIEMFVMYHSENDLSWYNAEMNVCLKHAIF